MARIWNKHKQSNTPLKRKVFVGMSGGIDSAVAAALLKKAGFDVVGIFMRYWAEPCQNKKLENRCCNLEAEGRARKTASKLGILFYVVNAEKEFKKAVVDYFIREYGAGRTPNPCVVCNKEIKFKILIEKAKELGADFVATGHYARLSANNECIANKRIRELWAKNNIRKLANSKKIRYSLMASKDKNKDQSYFLWQLGQKELEKILFPIGAYNKPQVRELAKEFGLPSLVSIPESQEVCFVLSDLGNFLARFIKIKPGRIVDGKGNVLGEHDGLPLYTIGQRKGIKLPAGPYYVIAKNFKKNELVVSKNEKDLFKNNVELKEVNWISGKSPKTPLKIKAQIRYRHKPSSAVIFCEKPNVYNLKFEKHQKSITSGQSAVFYKGNELLGGGVIM